MVENLRERDYSGANKWLREYVERNGRIRRKEWMDTYRWVRESVCVTGGFLDLQAGYDTSVPY